MEDVDFWSDLDWDPVYLASIFDREFDDMSELWNASGSVSDSDLLQGITSMENNKYSAIVEDISLDDDVLYSAVEHIEHE